MSLTTQAPSLPRIFQHDFGHRPVYSSPYTKQDLILSSATRLTMGQDTSRPFTMIDGRLERVPQPDAGRYSVTPPVTFNPNGEDDSVAHTGQNSSNQIPGSAVTLPITSQPPVVNDNRTQQPATAGNYRSLISSNSALVPNTELNVPVSESSSFRTEDSAPAPASPTISQSQLWSQRMLPHPSHPFAWKPADNTALMGHQFPVPSAHMELGQTKLYNGEGNFPTGGNIQQEHARDHSAVNSESFSRTEATKGQKKRPYPEIIDLTRDDSPPLQPTVKRLNTGVGSWSRWTLPTAPDVPTSLSQIQTTENAHARGQPSFSFNNTVPSRINLQPLVDIPPNPFKSYPTIIENINPDAARLGFYAKRSPHTIARDVIRAAGLGQPRLNSHLEVLLSRFDHIDEISDLSTFRWDLVDPTPESPAPIPLPGEKESFSPFTTTSSSGGVLLPSSVPPAGIAPVRKLHVSSGYQEASSSTSIPQSVGITGNSIGRPPIPSNWESGKPISSGVQPASGLSSSSMGRASMPASQGSASSPLAGSSSSRPSSMLPVVEIDSTSTHRIAIRPSPLRKTPPAPTPLHRELLSPTPNPRHNPTPIRQSLLRHESTPRPESSIAVVIPISTPHPQVENSHKQPRVFKSDSTSPTTVGTRPSSVAPSTELGTTKKRGKPFKSSDAAFKTSQETKIGPTLKKRGRPFGNSSTSTPQPVDLKIHKPRSRAAKTKYLVHLSPPTPSFVPFLCEWENCVAELHNLETLRTHILTVHKKQQPPGSWNCLWNKCTESGFVTKTEWQLHINDTHLVPFSWHMGDGPKATSTGTPTKWKRLSLTLLTELDSSPAQESPWLFDASGKQVTPSVRNRKSASNFLLIWKLFSVSAELTIVQKGS
jgi:hypothetical protein